MNRETPVETPVQDRLVSLPDQIITSVRQHKAKKEATTATAATDRDKDGREQRLRTTYFSRQRKSEVPLGIHVDNNEGKLAGNNAIGGEKDSQSGRKLPTKKKITSMSISAGLSPKNLGFDGRRVITENGRQLLLGQQNEIFKQVLNKIQEEHRSPKFKERAVTEVDDDNIATDRQKEALQKIQTLKGVNRIGYLGKDGKKPQQQSSVVKTEPAEVREVKEMSEENKEKVNEDNDEELGNKCKVNVRELWVDTSIKNPLGVINVKKVVEGKSSTTTKVVKKDSSYLKNGSHVRDNESTANTIKKSPLTVNMSISSMSTAAVFVAKEKKILSIYMNKDKTEPENVKRASQRSDQSQATQQGSPVRPLLMAFRSGISERTDEDDNYTNSVTSVLKSPVSENMNNNENNENNDENVDNDDIVNNENIIEGDNNNNMTEDANNVSNSSVESVSRSISQIARETPVPEARSSHAQSYSNEYTGGKGTVPGKVQGHGRSSFWHSRVSSRSNSYLEIGPEAPEDSSVRIIKQESQDEEDSEDESEEDDETIQSRYGGEEPKRKFSHRSSYRNKSIKVSKVLGEKSGGTLSWLNFRKKKKKQHHSRWAINQSPMNVMPTSSTTLGAAAPEFYNNKNPMVTAQQEFLSEYERKIQGLIKHQYGQLEHQNTDLNRSVSKIIIADFRKTGGEKGQIEDSWDIRKGSDSASNGMGDIETILKKGASFDGENEGPIMRMQTREFLQKEKVSKWSSVVKLLPIKNPVIIVTINPPIEEAANEMMDESLSPSRLQKGLNSPSTGLLKYGERDVMTFGQVLTEASLGDSGVGFGKHIVNRQYKFEVTHRKNQIEEKEEDEQNPFFEDEQVVGLGIGIGEEENPADGESSFRKGTEGLFMYEGIEDKKMEAFGTKGLISRTKNNFFEFVVKVLRHPVSKKGHHEHIEQFNIDDPAKSGLACCMAEPYKYSASRVEPVYNFLDELPLPIYTILGLDDLDSVSAQYLDLESANSVTSNRNNGAEFIKGRGSVTGVLSGLTPFTDRYKQKTKLGTAPILVYKDIHSVKQLQEPFNAFLRMCINFDSFTLTNLDCNMNMVNKIVDSMDDANWSYVKKSIMNMHAGLLNGMLESKYPMKKADRIEDPIIERVSFLYIFLYVKSELYLYKQLPVSMKGLDLS